MGSSKNKRLKMRSMSVSLLLAGTALSQEVQQTGPWVRVPNNYNPSIQPYPTPTQQRNPFEIGIQGGAEVDTLPFIKWGLGAVIIMLVISTSISMKFLPSLARASIVEEARSLGDMSTIAKFAFEAFDKFQELNNN